MDYSSDKHSYMIL